MTIDEAIEDFKTMAKNARNDIIDSDDLEPQEKHYNSQLELYAKEIEQIAEWLKDYKRIKMLIPIEKALKNEYNKAIDDFANLISQKSHIDLDEDYVDVGSTIITTGDVFKIAEQLKLKNIGKESEE